MFANLQFDGQWMQCGEETDERWTNQAQAAPAGCANYGCESVRLINSRLNLNLKLNVHKCFYCSQTDCRLGLIKVLPMKLTRSSANALADKTGRWASESASKFSSTESSREPWMANGDYLYGLSVISSKMARLHWVAACSKLEHCGKKIKLFY